MANNNLDLLPSQGSGQSAPGVSDAALARLLTIHMPSGSGTAPRGASAPQRLAAAIARLPDGSAGRNSTQLFLP